MGRNLNAAEARELKRLQRICDEWNATNPVGSTVMVKLDGEDEPVETTTQTKASVLSGHTPVIWLNGVSGCYKLTHVRAASTEAEKTAAADELREACAPKRWM